MRAARLARVARPFARAALVLHLVLDQCATAAAEALPPPRELQAIYLEAWRLYGKSGMRPVLPAMYARPQAWLAAEFCGKPCPIRAFQRRGELFFSDELDYSRPLPRSYITHELVHYVQYMRAGRSASSCSEANERELEAWAVQTLSLDAFFIYQPKPELMTCPSRSQ